MKKIVKKKKKNKELDNKKCLMTIEQVIMNFLRTNKWNL